MDQMIEYGRWNFPLREELKGEALAVMVYLSAAGVVYAIQ